MNQEVEQFLKEARAKGLSTGEQCFDIESYELMTKDDYPTRYDIDTYQAL